MSERTTANLKRTLAFAAIAMALAMTPGSAHTDAPAREGAAGASTQLADRTLVPRRIRLIINYKRPRLA